MNNLNDLKRNPNVIAVEGYYAFIGELEVIPVVKELPKFTVSGQFLYKPDTNCWYGGGRSYPADICIAYPNPLQQ